MVGGGKVKVYVVISDVGLNGPIIHGVYTEPPTEREITELVTTDWVMSDGSHFRVSGCTGYANTIIQEVVLNANLAARGWSQW